MLESKNKACEWTYDNFFEHWIGTLGIAWSLNQGTP